MKETAVELNNRKIRNGLRKQAEKIQRKKEKVWEKLKHVAPPNRFANMVIEKKAIKIPARDCSEWTFIEESEDLRDAYFKEVIISETVIKKVKPNGCK